MDIGALLATIGADITDLRRSVAQANSELTKYSRKTDEALSKVDSSWGKSGSFIVKTVGTLAATFAGMKMGSFLKDVAMTGARYETLGIVMTQVGKTAGYSGNQMKEYAEGVRLSGIQMDTSRDIIIRMTQAQINLADSTKLARIAQDTAVIGNINSSEALSRMIYGIQSGQLEVLKGIGINVSFEASYKKLADQLGTTSNALSAHQKMQARVNAVKEEGAKSAGIYEAAMETAGKQITSFPRYLNDFKIKMGEAFNPATADAVKTLTDFMKTLNEEIVKPEAQQALADLSKGFADWAVANTNLLKQDLPGYIRDIGGIIKDLKLVYDSLPEGMVGPLGTGLIGFMLFGKTGAILALTSQLVPAIANIIRATGQISSGKMTFFELVGMNAKELSTHLKKLEDDERNLNLTNNGLSKSTGGTAEAFELMNKVFPALNAETEIAAKANTKLKNALEGIAQEYARLSIEVGASFDKEKQLKDLAADNYREQQLRVLKATTPELEKVVALMKLRNEQEENFKNRYSNSEQGMTWDDSDLQSDKSLERTGAAQLASTEKQKQFAEKYKKATLDKYEYERYEAKKTYDELLTDWTMSLDDRNKASEMYAEELKKINKDEAASLNKEWKSAFDGWAKDWSKTLNDMVWGAETSFKDILGSFAKMLSQMLIQKWAVEPLFKFMSGGEEDSSGGLLGKLGSGIMGLAGGLLGGGTVAMDTSKFGAGSFDPKFDTGGMMGSDGKKKPFPAIVHSGEVIGTPDQMTSLYGNNKVAAPQTTNIYINAVDSKSFTEMVKNNPGGIISVISDAMTGNTGLRQTMGATI